MLGYPPFGHLVRVVVSGPGKDGPTAVLTEIRAKLEGTPGNDVIVGLEGDDKIRGRGGKAVASRTGAVYTQEIGGLYAGLEPPATLRG